MLTLLRNSLLLFFVSFFSVSVTANPLTELNTSGIVFDASCPNGEKVCANHPVDCMGGCALNATTRDTVFQWERTIFETQPDKDLRLNIQAMKKCLGRDAIRTALLKSLEQTPDTGSETLPCTVTGSEWQYIFPKYYISALTKPACDSSRSYLDQLTGSCQGWKNSAAEAGLWVGYSTAVLFGVMVSYLAVAQVGRCTGWFHWFTLGDGLGACYRMFNQCRGYRTLN